MNFANVETSSDKHDRSQGEGIVYCGGEKMHNASTVAGCAEMRRHHKMRCFAHLSETGDSPDTLIFYFQHNMKTTIPKISVCCCTYNRPQWLGELIHSWLIQTWPMEQRELIILDDGGQYGDVQGDGWQIVSFPRRFASLGEKRNACVSLTHPKSEIIIVADDDDIYLPHWLECHAKNFEHGAEWSFASSVYWSEGNQIVKKWRYEDEGWIMHPAHAFTKELFWSVGGYPHLAALEDHFFFEKLREKNIEHKDTLTEKNIPYLICRRHINDGHLHTTEILLEMYHEDFVVSEIKKASIDIRWDKDYLEEALLYEKSLVLDNPTSNQPSGKESFDSGYHYPLSVSQSLQSHERNLSCSN